MGYKSKKSPELNKVYTGECITTFRMLIKRFCRWRSFAAFGSNTNWLYVKHPYFPPWLGSYEGFTGQAPDLTVADNRYAFVTPTILHWLMPAYKGFRGAMRHKIVMRTKGAPSYASMVTRYSDDDGLEWRETFKSDATPTSIYQYPRFAALRESGFPYNDTNVPALGLGGTVICPPINPVLEIELPFYTQRRFANARHDHWAALDTYDLGGYKAFLNGTFTNNDDHIDYYAAAGDDFQLLFFVGLPAMYYFETLPVAKA